MGRGNLLAPIERIKYIEAAVGSGSDSAFHDVEIKLSVDSWTAADEEFTQTKEVLGLTADSNPVVMLKPAAEEPTEEELQAYACISNIKTEANSITFFADEQPVIELTLIIKGVAAAGTTEAEVAELKNKLEEKEDRLYQTLDSVDLNDYTEPIRAICTWCDNAPKNDECGSKGRLEVAVDFNGDIHQRYSMFAIGDFKTFAGVYERYKSTGNYDTQGEWSNWIKVGAPLVNSLTEDSSGCALDASQGKVLNDKITQINSDKVAYPDYNNTITVPNYVQLEDGSYFATIENDGFIRFSVANSEGRIVEVRINDKVASRNYYPPVSSSTLLISGPILPVKAGDTVTVKRNVTDGGGTTFNTRFTFIPPR